jgi:hypothetical protein
LGHGLSIPEEEKRGWKAAPTERKVKILPKSIEALIPSGCYLGIFCHGRGIETCF